MNSVFTLPLLPVKAIYYWCKTLNKSLPGRQFATYGFLLGFKLLFKGRLSFKLLFNPVSIVRYFEFDFVSSFFGNSDNKDILDVSSPYLFGFYLSAKNNCNYHYINPDKKDLKNVRSIAKKINFAGKYFTDCLDAKKMYFPDNNFDRIISISVIEHVNNNGDSDVIREMWRVLKPGGILILTFPVRKEYKEEFISENIYNLEQIELEGKYFFQRYYDDEKIEERLLSSIDNFEIVGKKVFGEITNGFYDNYKKKWKKSGYWETVKDPYYISKKFKYYPGITELTGLGVIGITIRKLV